MSNRSYYLFVAGVLAFIIVYTNLTSISSLLPIRFSDVEYVIITDKENYELGETILIKFQVLNPTEHDIIVPSITSMTFNWDINGKLNPKAQGASINPVSETFTLPPTNMTELNDFSNSGDIRYRITPTEIGNLTIHYTLKHGSETRFISKTVEILARICEYDELNISIITDKEEYQLGESVYYALKIGNPHNTTIQFRPPNSIETIIELYGDPVVSRGSFISRVVPYFDLEPEEDMVLFSFSEKNSFYPTRPGPLNITQIFNRNEFTVIKFVKIFYEHNVTEAFFCTDLKVDKTNASVGETVSYSFKIHSMLPYRTSFGPVPHITTPSFVGDLLMSQEVEDYGVKEVTFNLDTPKPGLYTITVWDMAVNFTVS